jgi:hypothetical protein
MDWGAGPSGRERFAQALLTIMFVAPADAALAHWGRAGSFRHLDLQGRIALCVIRTQSGVPSTQPRARHRP